MRRTFPRGSPSVVAEVGLRRRKRAPGGLRVDDRRRKRREGKNRREEANPDVSRRRPVPHPVVQPPVRAMHKE